MPIVQISRITNRKGLQENLPQLAGAELGWSVDERRLFIGNGTLQEGAPVVGNTEILTEFSDIIAGFQPYTYSGLAATGYAVQTSPSGEPVQISLQNWMDQYASVKDFGAKGDGVTDDTEAINWALYQLYCVEVNPQIRRSLFFPAGVYVVSESIVIPPYATLVGEGADNSVIQMGLGDDSALRAYVARTGDSLQQTGSNIGSNGAITPRYVTVKDMGFETLDNGVDVFLLDSAFNCTFSNVNFLGPLTTANLNTDADDIAGVRFNSYGSLVCQSSTFDRCTFTGTTYGINTDQQIQGITVSNSRFDTLYQGVVLGTVSPVNGGPTGFRVMHNFFDNIYQEGIKLGNISLNATGQNIFYDVANHFNGTTSPAASVIVFQSSNNISVGDLFERADAFATTYPRINLSGTSSIGIVNGEYLQLGSALIQTHAPVILADNTSAVIYSFDATLYRSIEINYSITRTTGVSTIGLRQGKFTVIPTGTGTLAYTDDSIVNSTTGVTLYASQVGSTVSVDYTTSNTGYSGSISFTVTAYPN